MHKSKFAIFAMRLSLLCCLALVGGNPCCAEANDVPDDVELKKQSPQLDVAKKSDGEKSLNPELTSSQKANELLRQGTLHHNNGYLPEAEQCFRQALILDPRNANGYFNLGAIAESRGDLITALGHYRAGLNVCPGDKEISEAVTSIEAQLKQMSSSDASSTRLARSTPAFTQSVSTGRAPVVSTSDVAPPVAPAITSSAPHANASGRQFQLKSSTSRTMGQAQATSPAPVATVTQPSRKKAIAKAALGAAVSIGLSTALRSSGLHCPVCRVVRFGF